MTPENVNKLLREQLVGPQDTAFGYTHYHDTPASLRTAGIAIQEPCPTLKAAQQYNVITSSLLSLFGIYVHLASDLILVRAANKTSFAIRKSAFDFQDVIHRTGRNTKWVEKSVVPNVHYVTYDMDDKVGETDVESTGAENSTNSQTPNSGETDRDEEAGEFVDAKETQIDTGAGTPLKAKNQEENLPVSWEDLFNDISELETKRGSKIPIEIKMDNGFSVITEPLPFLPIYVGYKTGTNSATPIDFSKPYKRILRLQLPNLILMQKVYTNIVIQTSEILIYRTPDRSAISECIEEYLNLGALTDVGEFIIKWFNENFKQNVAEEFTELDEEEQIEQEVQIEQEGQIEQEVQTQQDEQNEQEEQIEQEEEKEEEEKEEEEKEIEEEIEIEEEKEEEEIEEEKEKEKEIEEEKEEEEIEEEKEEEKEEEEKEEEEKEEEIETLTPAASSNGDQNAHAADSLSESDDSSQPVLLKSSPKVERRTGAGQQTVNIDQPKPSNPAEEKNQEEKRDEVKESQYELFETASQDIPNSKAHTSSSPEPVSVAATKKATVKKTSRVLQDQADAITIKRKTQLNISKITEFKKPARGSKSLFVDEDEEFYGDIPDFGYQQNNEEQAPEEKDVKDKKRKNEDKENKENKEMNENEEEWDTQAREEIYDMLPSVVGAIPIPATPPRVEPKVKQSPQKVNKIKNSLVSTGNGLSPYELMLRAKEKARLKKLEGEIATNSTSPAPITPPKLRRLARGTNKKPSVLKNKENEDAKKSDNLQDATKGKDQEESDVEQESTEVALGTQVKEETTHNNDIEKANPSIIFDSDVEENDEEIDNTQDQPGQEEEIVLSEEKTNDISSSDYEPEGEKDNLNKKRKAAQLTKSKSNKKYKSKKHLRVSKSVTIDNKTPQSPQPPQPEPQTYDFRKTFKSIFNKW